MTTNRKVVLAKHPDGEPKESDFEIKESELPELADGEVLLKVEHLSIDAFIRTMLNAREESFHGNVELGESPVTALGIGRVINSRSPDLNQGDAVFGPMCAQTHVIWPAGMLRKLDESEVPARTYLGALGMTTGLTAYAGMISCGGVREGDVVAVSAAGGAVGGVACQLAKIKGAHVIGIAGGKEKCQYLLDEIGCDDAIDYKAGDVDAAMQEKAPEGLDLFFDNVGGDILDAALHNLAMGGRIIICGAISQYNDMENVKGPRNYLKVAERNAIMRGFTVDKFAEQFPQMEADIAGWIKSGQLRMPEHIIEGIDHFPEALIALMSGKHMGKLLVAP